MVWSSKLLPLECLVMRFSFACTWYGFSRLLPSPFLPLVSAMLNVKRSVIVIGIVALVGQEHWL